MYTHFSKFNVDDIVTYVTEEKEIRRAVIQRIAFAGSGVAEYELVDEYADQAFRCDEGLRLAEDQTPIMAELPQQSI